MVRKPEQERKPEPEQERELEHEPEPEQEPELERERESMNQALLRIAYIRSLNWSLSSFTLFKELCYV